MTFPDGPLGRKKEPASAPCEMARLSRESAALFISILYFVSANWKALTVSHDTDV